MSIVGGVTSLANRTQLDSATERALLEQCRRRDFEAFGRIVDAYEARILGFVRRMVGHPDEALDITQEVFIKAFQGIERFDGRASLRTWLFRIAHNLCIDRARRADRKPPEARLEFSTEEEESIEVRDSRWNPETLVLDEEMRAVVERAVAGLSEKLRTVLLLHDREDMPYDEIAQAVGAPIGTVKSRLFLARSQVQAQVRRYLDGGIDG